MKQHRFSSVLMYILVLSLLFSFVNMLFHGVNQNVISYSDALQLFEDGKVQSFETQDDTLYLQLREEYLGKDRYTIQVSNPEERLQTDLGDLISQQHQSGVLESYNFNPDSKPSIFSKTMPYLLAGVVLMFLWVFFSSKAAGNANPTAGFTKAKANLGVPGGKPVTFQDVAGAVEEKEELQEVVDFLKNPEKFHEMGAKIPKGILLVGPPGTGKTLLARAVAGEAGVQFLSISGSDFVELFVGVGAGRVRDLFEQAKKMAPSIIFIDEIDAVGRRRGAGMGGGHDEREQTLNQLLVEMDGFQKNEEVIVMAATNRQDILDPALLRPGRFDRKVYVGRPDVQGREAILGIHSKDKKLSDDVELRNVALATPGFTGADLANLMNEAAILAVRKDRPVITKADLDEARMKVIAGPERKSHVIQKKDLKITAIHESGHAVAMYYLPTHDPVEQISIIPRGQALGVTISVPTEDTVHMTRTEMYEQIVSLLGGRVSEELFCHDISTGASNDIQRATQMARDMVARYGMSDRIGALSYDNEEEVFIGRDYEKTKSYSEKVAGDLDEETKAIVDKAYAHCKSILTDHRDQVLAVSDFLLSHETMSAQQFQDCMEGKEIVA